MNQIDRSVRVSRGKLSLTDPFEIFRVFVTHASLIARLAAREVAARYRGSLLGAVWFLLTPLMLLSVYTFVFAIIFQARWNAQTTDRGEFALLFFSGLIIYTIFSEVINRSPALVLDNASYVTKVVFPLEILPCVALLSALVNAGFSFVIFLVFYALVIGWPPATILMLPILLVPLCLLTLGLSWFLASVGTFFRDLRQFVPVATMMLMFLSPIFFPLSAIPVSKLPSPIVAIIHLNPIALILEMSKDVLFWNRVPDLTQLSILLLLTWLVAWFGYLWFAKTRKGFADVV